MLDVYGLSLQSIQMFAPQAAGIFGVVLYLLGYCGLQLQLICGKSLTYTLLNLSAAAMVLISLTKDFNLASALIQTIWIVISIIGLAMRFKSNWCRN